MAKSFKLGYEGVLYYSDTPLDQRPGDPTGANNYQTVTWNELDNVMDVDMNADSDSVDTTTRAEAKKGWKSEVKTTKDGKLSTTIRWKPADTGFQALRNAWLAGTEVALLDLDGSKDVIADQAQGLVGNFTVSFGQKKPVKGIMTV
ncbi:MAG: hypothetical protein KDA60_20330, partial [Planctomycetales bacterium]|nr:hypothetical protein [Planctomycetales bacterium]